MKPSMKLTIKILLFFSLLACSIPSGFGQIYVNSLSTGNNDGTSWNNAYTNLGAALQVATIGSEVWVATGTYLPALSDRNASFQIPSGVRVLGGFPNSGNPSISDRDWQRHPTLLSGDIDGDGTLMGNSYSIVYIQNATSTTILDGFIVQDGNADDAGAGIRGSYGGGVLNYADVSRTSHIEIRNATFQNNKGINGGAIGNYSNAFESKASIKLVNTQFLNNVATSQGGAIYNNGSQSASFEGQFINCEFSNNLAQSDGGAICSNASGNGLVDLTIEGCQFLSNRTNTGSGGGIYHISNADGTVNCTITNSKFDDNKCGQYGGGISAFNSDGNTVTTLINNSIFTDNYSRAGGAIYCLGAGRGTVEYTIVNSVFYNNEANIAGAIYFNEQNFSTSTTTATVEGHFYNSIFKNNTAIDFDPLFHFSGTPEMYFQNCLMSDIRNCEDKILGRGDAVCLGGMIYFQDPLFVNEAAKDFHLAAGSPALDAGNNTLVPANLTLDLDGNLRILNGTVDIGVYERSSINSDTDNDGIMDAADNCPLVANADQTDLDNDGAGAACDCDDAPTTGASCRNGCIIFYRDQDGDGFGADGTNLAACVAPDGYVSNNLDCNDTNATIFPNATELCDGIDNNCNGQEDEDTDDDNDGICNEEDICPNGDDTVDSNNNGTPDDCESILNITCPADLVLTANVGQNEVIANWQEPTASTNCATGSSGSRGDCGATSIIGLSHIGSMNGSNYFLSQTQKNWTQAQAEAESLNGHLVVINNATENLLIKEAIGNNVVHIGLRYDSNTGNAFWVNGEPITYDNQELNTNTSTVNQYGLIHFWNGQWNYHGDYSKFYVIEIPCGGGGESTGIELQQTGGLSNGANFPVGTTTITYEATDDCGGTTTCSFDIIVEPSSSSLTLDCPSNTIETTLPGATTVAVDWSNPVPQTDCPLGTPDVNIAAGLASGDLFPVGTTVVTYTATDNCGSNATCSFEVIVSSGISSLSLSCPDDINVTASPVAVSTIATWIDPSIQTDCTIGTTSLSTLTGQVSGDLFSVGTTTVTYEATDECGSTATCSFNVTVTNSSSMLSITCPEDITQAAVSGTSSAMVSWEEPLTQSDCVFGLRTPIVTSGKGSGELFPVGITLVTYEVGDGCGSSTTCSFEVTVTGVDNDLSLECPGDITIDVAAGTTSSIAIWTNPVPLSNCSVSPNLALMTSLASGDAFPLGASTVTYEAVDPCGGFSTCSFQVTLHSIQSGDLTITCPADVTITVPAGATGGIASWETPTANSSCTTGDIGDAGETFCTADAISGFNYIGELEGHHYYISTSPLTWPNAKDACERSGGHLVVIDNQIENDFIFSAANEMVHIGLTDKETEGTFGWVDGSLLQYDNTQSFIANSPINNYAVMYNWQPGKWGYISADVWKNYIMEVPCSGGGTNISINQIAGEVSGSTFSIGQTIITYQASDACDNSTTCNFIVEVVEQVVTCDEDSNAGTIEGEETNCGPYTTIPISNSSLPSEEGDIEYLWLSSTAGCPISIGEQLPNEQGESLTVGFITQTTYYVRWSRRVGCVDWLASNCITKTVEDCGGPIATAYCESAGTQPWQEWIGEVQLESISNPSGKSSSGYDNFTDLSTSLIGGQSYEVGVLPAFSYTQWNEHVYVWIDFNQDNDFDDAGELVLNKVYQRGSPASTPSIVTNSFQVPIAAINGTTRMRVAMKREGTLDPCETFNNGEVEDYSIIISGASDRSTSNTFEQELAHFQIHPNPSTEFIRINFEEVIDGCSIQVLNVFGQVLGTYDNIQEESLTISLAQFSSGLYYVSYSTPHTPAMSKSFVVDKGY